MERRDYISLLGSFGVSFLPGCASLNLTDTPTSSPTPTEPEPTETPTPEPPSFKVVEIRSPKSVALDQSFRIEIEVENNGGQSGTWEEKIFTKVTYGPKPENWDILEVDLIIPPGESRTWRSSYSSYEEPAVVYFRVGEEGPIRTVEVPGTRAPIMTEVNLVSEWESYGDAVDNRITEAEAGSVIYIAFRYWYWVENQTFDAYRQVKIYDENNERVGLNSSPSEQVVDRNGWVSWETYMSFSTTGWGPGTYIAEVLIRDNQNMKVSELSTTEFQLT